MEEPKITNLVKFYSLLLLNEGPKYGYEIIKETSKQLEKNVSSGQIYPFLNKLEKSGYLKSGKRGEREKKAYKLTPRGKKFVEHMLSRFGGLLELAIEPKVKVCAHCGCKVLEGGHHEKIGKKNVTFCCSHCARSFRKAGHGNR